jgi:hypothetical protein
MKKDPDTEKGRNVTAVRHDEKSALRLNGHSCRKSPLLSLNRVKAGLALEDMSKEQRLASS